MAHITDRKTQTVSSLKDLLDKSKSVSIIDYTGLSVSQATALRQAVRKVGGQMLVTKNTLFKVASGLKDFDLKGLSAFIFSQTDEISAPKAVADFSKKNSILTFKAGLLGDRILSSAEIIALAATPPKETSIGKLLYLLNWNTSKLVRTLDAIAKSK